MKYNLAIVNNTDCDCINDESKPCDEKKFPNRQIFITDCIPLINLKDGNKNILDWRRDNGYIYFNPNNRENYYLDTNFNLTRYDEEIKFDQHSLELLIELYSKLNCDIVISTSSSSLASSSSLTSSGGNALASSGELASGSSTLTSSSELASSSLTTIKIPVYYLYCNKNNEIFNIFITQCIIIYGDFKIFGDLFRINTNDNTFITLSYKFNIFNISLLCEKFFDIIPLFFGRYEQDEIIKRLNEIFVDFNFVNLYTTINGYKYMLKTISTKPSKSEYEQTVKDLNNEFLQSKPKNKDLKFTDKVNPKYQDYKKLYNIENNTSTNENSQGKIISDLAKSIILIRNVLTDVNHLIPNFDKLFLMSILSYRLKEGLINATWPFNIDSIGTYITKNSEETKLDNKILLNIYRIQKPIIYEYSQVIYKEELYGNCMESTILQLLKILFTNPEIEKFDETIIRKIIKDEHVEFIVDIFKRIDLEEKTTKFDLDWVRFITELPDQYPEIGIYDFLREGKKEINTTFANLILSLKCLTKIEYKAEDTPTIFLNSIIKIIDQKYSIIIKNETSEDIVIIYCYNNYTMKLIPNIHANFESAKIDKSGLLNILENIKQKNKSLIEYLNMNSYLTYSEISNYIYLCSLVYTDIDLFNKYIALLTKEKKQIYFNMIFSDSVIPKISTVIFDSIFSNNIDIKYFENFINWFHIFMYIKSEFFWSWIIKNDIHAKYSKWNENNVYFVFSHLKSDVFWQEIIDQGKYINWDKQFFEMAIKCINSEIFWKDIIKKNIKIELDTAIEYVNSEVYWEYIIKNLFYENWSDKNWLNAIRYIKSDNFWQEIVTKLIYERWDDIRYWITATKSVKSTIFWDEIIRKRIYEKWDIKLWSIAIVSIDYELLWDTVINDENICRKWDNDRWIETASVKKSVYFWSCVFEKKYYEKWNENKYVWTSIITHLNFNIELQKIFEYIVNNNICANWNIDIWKAAISNNILNNYEYFWKEVIDKRFYEEWNFQVWSFFGREINIESIWIYIIEKKIYEKWNEYKDYTISILWDNILKIISEDFWLIKIENDEISTIFKNPNFFWYKISSKKKYVIFWLKVFEKKLHISWTGETWNQFIIHINIESIWKDITDNDLYIKWNNDCWLNAKRNIKYKNFWIKVFEKKLYKKWNNHIWKNFLPYIHEDEDIILEDIFGKELYKGWESDVWDIVIKNIKSEKFWSKVIEKKIYVFWNYNLWIEASKYIELKEFWKNIDIDINHINYKEIKQLVIENQSKYKLKYIKYKMKYLQLKTKQ